MGRSGRIALVGALVIAACAAPGERNSKTMEQGRLYTAWLYGSEYGKLWDRLTPELRQVFGSAAELGKFAGKAVTRLGSERQTVEEHVADARPDRVYSRTASFTSSLRPVLIEWTLTPEGSVSGLAVRPVPESDSGAATDGVEGTD